MISIMKYRLSLQMIVVHSWFRCKNPRITSPLPHVLAFIMFNNEMVTVYTITEVVIMRGIAPPGEPLHLSYIIDTQNRCYRDGIPRAEPGRGIC